MATPVAPPGFELDENPAKSTPPPPEGFVADAPSTPATPPPPHGFSLDVAPKRTAKELAEDDTFDPAGHAVENPGDFELAYEAQKARDNRSFGQKALAAGKVLATPSTYVNAGKGVMNFVRGFDDIATNIAGTPILRTIATGGVVPASALGAPARPEETRLAERTLAAQHGEESIKHVLTAVGSAADAIDPSTWLYETPEMKEHQARLNFQDRVEVARKAALLAKGQPIDTGAVAGIYHAAGQQPSQEVGPQALKEMGVPQADLPTVERMATSSDPVNIALAAAPGLPGAAKVGGAITEAAGNVLSGTGTAIRAAGHVLNPLTSLRRLVNPTAISTDAAKEGGARGLQGLGSILAQQGRELRTGTPSALTTKAATAAATGQSAIGTNLQRAVGDTAGRAVTTAVGMAPVNAALSDGNPEDFARSEVGAAAFGVGLGAFARNRKILVEAVRPHLRSEGARALAEAGEGNDPLAARSATYVMGLPEEARDRVLETIGALQGLPATTPTGPKRAKLYVLSDADYQNVIAQKFGMHKAAMGGGRGFFLTDDGQAFINGEYHSGLPASELSHTIGHEFGGHAAINIMRAAGAKGGALYDGLMNTVKENLMPSGRVSPEFYRFIAEYNRAFDPTGQTKRLDPRNPEAIEEWISEQAGHIIAGKGVGELALPRNIQDKIHDGIGRFMGGMIGMDTREVGTKTHFGRQEVGEITKAVQDTLEQVVGMKLRDGAEMPEAPKTDTTRIAELQTVIDTPRPAQGSPLEAVQQWNEAQRAAREELATLAPGQSTTPTEATQAASPPPVPIPAPAAPAPVVAPIEPTAPAQKPPEVLPPAANPPQPTPTNEPRPTQPAPAFDIPEKSAGTAVIPERPAPETEPAPLSEETITKIAAEAGQAVVAARAGTKKKASTLPKETTDAQVDAVTAEHDKGLPANYQGVRSRTDALGKTTISGTFNPKRAFDAFLLKLADLSPKHVGILQSIQAKLGQTVTVNYGHAPHEDGEVTKGGRKTAQAASSAQARASGETTAQNEDKNFIPLEVRFNKGKDTPSITVIGASPEKLLNNFNHAAKAVAEVIKKLGIEFELPYRDIHDPRLVADMKAVALNHANGWKGDGSAKIEGFPDTTIPQPGEGFKPIDIPTDRFEFLNLMLGDESAKTGVRGLSPEQRLKQGLAVKNQIPMTDAGETNPLREAINASKGPVTGADGKETTWSRATLENPLSEALRVDLINEVKPEVNNEDASIRPHGYAGDISRFFAEGSPNRNFSAAGFLPDTGAPKAGGNVESLASLPRDKFRRQYVVHFDTRPGAEERIESIMRDGLKSGMVSTDIDNFTPEETVGKNAPARGWARASGADKPGAIAYVIEDKSVPRDSRMKPGTKPVAWVRLTKEGQSVHDALTELSPPKTAKEKAQERIAARSKPETIPMANGSITKGPSVQFLPAFHGTPHKVDKFSTDKIGTGEGAQVYGWGLYFAENEKVGEEYRKVLSAKEGNLVRQVKDRTGFALPDGAIRAALQFTSRDGETEDAARRAQYASAELRSLAPAEVLAVAKAARESIGGNAYTVDIDAEPHELLDWDKSLKDQHPKIQEALAKLDPDSYSPSGNDYDANEVGQQIYHRLWENLIRTGKAQPAKEKQKQASDTLQKLGIVGIQYLDEGSRVNVSRDEYGQWNVESQNAVHGTFGTREAAEKFAKGIKATRNFVVFDDSRITITHENGEPVTPKERREALGQRQGAKEAARARLEAAK